ncbi:hypothetical protein [Herbaspirillum sp. B65]|uniref:hypothetical protein n=1 Tax=Herbaspirillum sp. B65 TaxID=137708 RepID=UPI0011D234A2|nr:hypothetical protein [Herbaspirillum sp. B65]
MTWLVRLAASLLQPDLFGQVVIPDREKAFCQEATGLFSMLPLQHDASSLAGIETRRDKALRRALEGSENAAPRERGMIFRLGFILDTCDPI